MAERIARRGARLRGCAARALTVGLAALAVTVFGIGGGASPASASASDGIEYVSLGDSFAAGSGVWAPRLTGPDPVCWQSTANFAHRLARANHYRLIDVSCGGAATGDLSAPQRPTLEPQLAALSEKTDLVTILIGGNDGGVFGSVIEKCVIAGVRARLRGNPCQTEFGDSFVDRLRTDTFPAVKQALVDVHHRAPNARVLIGTYPWVVPMQARSCPDLLVANGDIPYAHEVQRVLNSVIVTAAEQTRTEVVDFAAASVGHDACQRPGVRWVEPIMGTTQAVPVHPNALGERQMARVVANRLESGPGSEPGPPR